MEQQLCVLACSALGETGALIFALAAFAWGLWQRRGRVQTDAKVVELDAERTKLAAETKALEAEIKVLSLRPPALPAFLFTTPTPIPAGMPSTPSTTTSAPPAPPSDPHSDEEPFSDETLR